MTRRLTLSGLVAGAITLTACSDLSRLIDPHEFSDARIEVDPTIIRTIHHAPVNGVERASEITTKRIEELECLRAAPWCDMSEMIHVIVHNTGTRPIYLENREYGLERFADGAWHRVHTGYKLTLDWTPPPPIHPNESETLPVSVRRMRPGLYRLSVFIWGITPILSPDVVRTSDPFYFQPLPDYRSFECPDLDLTALAEELARERMQQALVARYPGHHDWMLQIENQFPGFGGVYEEGSPVVFMKDESNIAGVTDWARSVWGRTPRIRKGNFSYSELLSWEEAMQRKFFFELERNGRGLPELGSFGIDVVTNRLRIVVSTELARADAECLAQGMGMPEGMAYFTEGRW